MKITWTKITLIIRHYNGSKGTDNLQLCMKRIQIEQVCEFKYLGIILDEQLKFDAKAEYSVTKARIAFAKVSRLFDGKNRISVQLGIELYKCLVRPYLEYSVAVWTTM